MSDASVKSTGIRLGKEERKELLAQLERRSSRSEPPERILQRGEQALRDGHLDQARRLLGQLEANARGLAGLELFRQNVAAAVRDDKHRTNLKATEEMLSRYIQQRKKPLAELALATLIEIAPHHHRRAEYESWVADLDKEMELQNRIEEKLEAGRAALLADDIAGAEKHLAALRKVDPLSRMTEQLAAEIQGTAQGQVLSAGIRRAKERLDELLASGRLDEAEEQMELLSRMDIPKVTVDFLRQRLEEGRRRLRDQVEAEELIALFERHLEDHDWPNAREAAQRFGQRFAAAERAAELFRQVNDLEAAERRQQSVEEGLTAVEQFIAEGDRHNAELALKLLAGLDLDPDQLAQLESRVSRIQHPLPGDPR